MSNSALINVVLSILELMNCVVNQVLELILPTVVKLIEAGVTLNTVLSKS